MSDLENKIRELEHKLAVKKAYLDVQFKFSKGIDSEVREIVTNKLIELVQKLAEEQEINVESNQINDLSKEDIKILKLLAESVKSKQKEPKVPVVNKTIVEAKFEPVEEIEQLDTPSEYKDRMARIITLDGIPDIKTRGLVEPSSTVRIKNIHNNLAYVQDLKGNSFNIQLEDLELKPRRQK